MNNLKKVSDAIDYLVQDVENIGEKDYLKMAIASHIERDTKLPRGYIDQVVKAYFDGFKC